MWKEFVGPLLSLVDVWNACEEEVNLPLFLDPASCRCLEECPYQTRSSKIFNGCTTGTVLGEHGIHLVGGDEVVDDR